MRYLSFSVLLLLLIVSCRKDKESKANELIGNYYCEAHSTSHDISGYETDTTYMTNLIVTGNTYSIEVLNTIVPIDSLRVNGFYEFGGYPEFFKIKFTEDSIYFYHSVSGQGGSGGTFYKGLKTD